VHKLLQRPESILMNIRFREIPMPELEEILPRLRLLGAPNEKPETVFYGCENSLACGINSKYTRLGRFVCQLPLHCAHPHTPRNIAPNPAATTQPGTHLRLGAERNNASAAGHAATHCIQPVHSADLIVISRSIGSAEGQAFAHFPQSMHGSAFRRMRRGLANETSPISAP